MRHATVPLLLALGLGTVSLLPAHAEIVQLRTRDTAAFEAAVARAVAAWKATDPDTSFLSVGNDIQYGIGWLEALKPTEASWRFETAVKAAPDNVFAHYFLGLSYYGMGRWADAQKAFATVTRLAPDWVATTAPWVQAAGNAQRAEAQTSRPAPSTTPAKPAPTTRVSPAPDAARPTPAPAPGGTTTPPKAASFPKSVPVGTYPCVAQVRTLTGYSSSGGLNIPQYQYRRESRGSLTIVDTTRYRIGNGTFTYAYDARTGKITWKSGPLATARPGDSDYGLDGERNRVISVWIAGEQRFCLGGRG